MQGISAIIVVVLILLITVSLASAGYLFFSNIFSQTTTTASSGISQITTGMSQNFVIEAVSGKQITIRNTGQTPITNFAIYVDEKPVNFTNSSKIVNPGEIYTFFVYDFIDYSYPRTLKITIPGIVQTKQVGKENSDPSLLGYWKFDEGLGTIAYDSSIYGNDGQLVNNPQWVNGKYGKALQFNGNDNYVDVGNKQILNIKGSLTIESIINKTDKFYYDDIYPRYGWYGIAGKGTYREGYRLLYYQSFNETRGIKNVTFPCLNTSYLYYTCFESNVNISSNLFIHVILVFDNSTGAYLYHNGIQVGSSTNYRGILNVTNLPFLIGKSSDTKSFNGTIDEVRVWNRPLIPEEVLNHYLHGPV